MLSGWVFLNYKFSKEQSMLPEDDRMIETCYKDRCSRSNQNASNHVSGFILPVGYLNFSTWFMKNVLFEQKKR